jgi:hypothetical protein
MLLLVVGSTFWYRFEIMQFFKFEVRQFFNFNFEKLIL